MMDHRKGAKCFWVKALSPLLSGAGEGHGLADISLQRDSIMGIPKVDGSAIKGAVLDAHPSLAKVQLSFSDLRLLFFPVRSSHKLYMLITCPFCMERFLNEMIWYGYLENSACKEQLNGFIVNGELKMWKKDGDFTVLVDKPYKIGTFPENKFEIPFSQLGIQTDDMDRMALVSNKDFLHFVQQETEVIQRIDVEKGFLFTEEYLPEKSILYGIVNEFPDLLHPPKASVLTDVFNEKACELQLGKNVTLDKGQIRLVEIGAEGNEYNRI